MFYVIVIISSLKYKTIIWVKLVALYCFNNKIHGTFSGMQYSLFSNYKLRQFLKYKLHPEKLKRNMRDTIFFQDGCAMMYGEKVLNKSATKGISSIKLKFLFNFLLPKYILHKFRK